MKALRFLSNLLIAAAWLFVFQALGWITFHPTQTMEWWQLLLATALLTKLAEWIVDVIYFAITVGTCLVGGCLLAIPLMVAQGWIWLTLTSYYTNWFTINVSFWWTGLLMSVAYGLVRIPSETSSTSSSSAKTTTITTQ